MRKILCLLISLLMIFLCACGDKDKTVVSSNGDNPSLEENLGNGVWTASYEETFKHKSLYAKNSPFSAVGDNLIENFNFDNEVVEKGEFTLNTWVEQGEWTDAYTIPTTGGLNGTPGMVFKHSVIGKSNTYAGYLMNVKENTNYVLTARLTTRNGSKPVIRVLAESDKRVLSQISGGYDDAWEQVSITFNSGSDKRIIIIFIGNAVGRDLNTCKNGYSLLDDLCVFETNTEAGAALENNYHVKEGLSYKDWAGKNLTAKEWGIADLYWHSNARIFYYNSVPEPEGDDSGNLILRGRRKGDKLGYFGVEFTWDTKLEKGYAYKFKLNMPFVGEIPDFITVNDKIVWSQQYDSQITEDGSNALEFVYVCENDEYARIRMICETCIKRGDGIECSRRMVMSPNGDWSKPHIECLRAELSTAPKYKKYDFNMNTEFVTAGDKEGARMLQTSVNAKAGEINGLTKLDYDSSSVNIYENSLNIMLESGFKTAKKLKLDTLTYNPSDKDCADFSKWSKRAKDAGIKNLVVGLVLPNAKKDGYVSANIKDLSKIDSAVSATAEVVNKWLKTVSDGSVIVRIQNADLLFGSTLGGIENSPVASLKGYETVKDGGLSAYTKVSEFVKELKEKIFKKVDSSDKVKFALESSTPTFDITNFVNSGSDILLSNAPNRVNYNISLAALRGAGKTADLPYGVYWNTWNGSYRYGMTNDAVFAGFLSLFYGGSNIIGDDLAVHSSGDAISTQGEAWYNGVRFAKAHPSLGQQVVNTAIIRGEGDEWSTLTAKTSGAAYSLKFDSTEMDKALELAETPTKWAAAAKAVREGRDVLYSDTYVGDYSLMDIIFTKFGNAASTDTQHLFTGTPYGTADIISDTVSLETLQKYKTVIYCGRGKDITKETVTKLEDYVKKGGNLVIAVGQLKDKDGNLVVDEFAGISLVKSKIVDGLPYTYIHARGAKVIKKHKNGDPQALYKKTGKGQVALFSGEYLSSYDTEVARDTITVFLSQNMDVKFAKAADNIEYIPSVKGKSIIIPFINQGRGYYPSGNSKDNGAWTGNVSVNVENFGLDAEEVEVYRVLQKMDGSTPVSLSKIKFEVDDETVVFNINSAIIDEIVIGPKGQVEKDYFS